MVFRRQTLFVVGAGASAELGLPVGAALTHEISALAKFKTDDWGRPASQEASDLLHQLRSRSDDRATLDTWVKALRQISEGVHLKRSIDSYIDQHPEQPAIAEMGKLLIAMRILNAEQKSALSAKPGAKPNIRSDIVRQSWLDQFAAMLFENLRFDNLDQISTRIDVVCFNYDRCIEHYLTHALSTTYAISLESAAKFVDKINIIHPYGSLGPLRKVAFGEGDPNYWDISANLKTFTESADTEVEARIEQAVQRAEQHVYLGFSFGRQNMELLTIDNHFATPFESAIGRHSYASGFGQYEQARPALARQMESVYGYRRYDDEGPSFTHIEIGVRARELLDRHWHNIMTD